MLYQKSPRNPILTRHGACFLQGPLAADTGGRASHRAKTEQTVGNGMNALAPAAMKDRYECVVIDDDPDICALISRVLSKIGVTSLGLVERRGAWSAR